MLSPIFGSTWGRSERAVEYDWVISRLPGGSSPFTLLDVGALDGTRVVERFWRALPSRVKLFRLDLIPEACGVKADIQADIRHLEMSDDAFDVVVAISTLEHIEEPELALRNMIRLAKHKVLITMPYGKAETHPWGIQYDQERLQELSRRVPVSSGNFKVYFGYDSYDGWSGWSRVIEYENLSKVGYGTEGAPFAAGVVCWEIEK